MIEISIILPVYNVEKYLKRCIESILSQTFKNFEIIAINDGSEDCSGKILDKYQKSDSRIRVIHQKNKGVGQTRNIGLKEAKGKYIYFCDPDDYLEPDLLEDNVKLANKYNANLLIFSYFHEEYHPKNYIKKVSTTESKFLENRDDFIYEFSNLLNLNLLNTLWNKLYKRQYLEKNKCIFSSSPYGEDSVFNYSIFKNLDRVYINEKAYYHYIAKRPGSAANVYRKNNFWYRYEEATQLELLIDYWAKRDKFEELLLNDWLKTLFFGLNNLFLDNSPLDKNGIKSEIQSIVTSKKINYLLENISLNNINNKFQKLILYFVKNKKINTVYYLYKMRNKLKEVTVKF